MNIRYPIYEGVYRILTFFLSAVSDTAVFFLLGFSVGSLFIVHGF